MAIASKLKKFGFALWVVYLSAYNALNKNQLFTTERLYIRQVCIDDKESMFTYRSDPDTNKFLSLIPQSADDVAAFINNTSSEINIPGTWFQLVIIEQTSDLLIGDIGLHFLDNGSQNKQVEIGYTL